MKQTMPKQTIPKKTVLKQVLLKQAMPKQNVTLKMIAQQAGLSIATVSRVVNTPHLTSQEAQHQVNLAITELNFDTKNFFKRHAKNHRINKNSSKRILVIDNQLMVNTLINSGIEYRAKEAGYKLLYLRFFYFNDQEIQRIISYAIAHRLDGIIIINDSPYLKKLLQFQYALPPIVLVNQFSLFLPCVYFDHLSIAYQATQYLTELGHKRIAILLGDKCKTEVDHLRNGYMQALARANIAVIPDFIAYQCMDYHASSVMVKKMMNSTLPPTAIICSDHLCLNYADRESLTADIEGKFNYLTTIESSICGVIDQCQTMNINVPEELSLLQFVHSKSYKLYNPLNYICAMHKPLFSMGEESMELLISLLDSDQQIRPARLIESELVIRSSTSKTYDYWYKCEVMP